MNEMQILLWTFILLSARFYGALTICPIFSDSKLPKLVRILLAGLFSLIFVPHFINSKLGSSGTIFKLFLLTKEIFIGLTLGYLFSLPIWLVENVGNVIDMQRGEQFGALIDQSTKNPSSSISKLLLQAFLVYFITANGILFFIKFIGESFEILPYDNFSFNYLASQEIIIELFSTYFYWIVILALPVIFLMFLLEITLGIFSSFIQQLNVTTLAMPLKSIVSLFILVFYIGVIYHVAISKFTANIYQIVLAH